MEQNLIVLLVFTSTSSFRRFGKLQKHCVFLHSSSGGCPWTLCGWSTKGQRRAHFLLHPEGGLQCTAPVVPPTYVLCVECVSGCSSSPHLQPPPPPALVDRTPTLPTANSNSAPRLHGYAGLLSKIKPLNPLVAVWRSSGEKSMLPCSSCSSLSRD